MQKGANNRGIDFELHCSITFPKSNFSNIIFTQKLFHYNEKNEFEPIYVKDYLILHIKELIFNVSKSFLSLCDKMLKLEPIKFYKHVQWKRRFRLLYMLHMHAIFILVGNEPSAYSIFNVISSCFVIHVFKSIHSR